MVGSWFLLLADIKARTTGSYRLHVGEMRERTTKTGSGLSAFFDRT